MFTFNFFLALVFTLMVKAMGVRAGAHGAAERKKQESPEMLNMIQRRTEHLRARNAWRWGAVRIKKLSLRPGVVFVREWARSPRLAGAVCPSGTALAKAMADRVPAGTGLVVDLGAGTGAVTAALLKKGIAPQRIVVVEQSAAMAKYLRKRFPGLMVLRGDAAELSSLLPKRPVDCVISSLPLVSLPEAKRESIVRELKRVLQGRPLVQFTYFWGGSYLSKKGFSRVSSRLVLKNLPPARVMEFV